MNYTFEKGEKSTVRLTIELDKNDWTKAIDAAYEKTKGRYGMPGFRKGKVPKKVLETAYGKGIFYEDAINVALSEYYGEILKKEPKIEDVAQPEVDVQKISDDGVTLLAVIPVKPEVVLGNYKGINFTRKEYNVKDEDVEADIDRLRDRNSRMVEVTDRAVENGDTVTIDYSGSVDGVKFDGGTAEKQPLTIGSNTFIPGFEEQIVGMKIGEDRDVKVKFPDDYHAEELKGKDAVFAIKLHEIKKKELPELNDEFIKDAVGAESVEAYRKEVRARMEKQNADRAESVLEDDMIKKITETSDVELCDALVENELDRMVEEMSYRLSYQGLKFEDYLKYIGKTVEDYRKENEDRAKENVKTRLVFDKLIEMEQIEATDDDVKARIEEMAKEQNKPVPEVEGKLKEPQLNYIRNEIIVKKLFEDLKKLNTIENKAE